MAQQAPDLKFASVRKLDTSYDGMASGLDEKHPLLPIAQGFIDNMERVRALANLTPMIIGLMAEKAKRLRPDPEAWGHYNSLYHARRITHPAFMGSMTDPLGPLSLGNAVAPERQLTPAELMNEQVAKYKAVAIEEGYVELPNWAAREPLLFTGLRALLSAMLIGGWTAYESLATDLWIEAVNQRPMDLGINALLAPRRPSQADVTLEEKRARNATKATKKPTKRLKRRPTPLSFDILKEYRFNLQSKLGTMMRDKRKFDFNSLEGISSAYQATFCERDKDGDLRGVPSKVKAWFAGADHKALGYVEAIRHVMVHKGGLADEPFRERVKSHPVLSKVEPGKPVPIDGESATEYINVARRCAMALFRGVRDWLAPPTRKE